MKKQSANRALRKVEGLGSTERAWTMGDNGAVWKVVSSLDFERVVIRKTIDTRSDIVREVDQGEELTQKGWAELFADGQAKGLVRMPVLPDGWVTVDASKVGGPTYLEMIKEPPEQQPKRAVKEKEREKAEKQKAEQADIINDLLTRMWQVIFKSGTEKGDIIVRKTPNLHSEEVLYLCCGDLVEENGTVHTPAEGVPRMPIRTKTGHEGWVTLDATAKGGPQFFTKCQSVEKVKAWYEERQQLSSDKKGENWKKQPVAKESRDWWKTGGDWKDTKGDWSSGWRWNQEREKERGTGKGEPRRKAKDDDEGEEENTDRREKGDKQKKKLRGVVDWNKTRHWTVVATLPIAVVPDLDAPLPPGKTHELAVGYLKHPGLVVEQTGHSKKLKHHMLMPIKCENPLLEGWVTRREIGGDAFFEEIKENHLPTEDNDT